MLTHLSVLRIFVTGNQPEVQPIKTQMLQEKEFLYVFEGQYP